MQCQLHVGMNVGRTWYTVDYYTSNCKKITFTSMWLFIRYLYKYIHTCTKDLRIQKNHYSLKLYYTYIIISLVFLHVHGHGQIEREKDTQSHTQDRQTDRHAHMYTHNNLPMADCANSNNAGVSCIWADPCVSVNNFRASNEGGKAKEGSPLCSCLRPSVRAISMIWSLNMRNDKYSIMYM